MSNYNLFLDDYRLPKQVHWIQLPMVHWEIVRNYDEFVTKIKSQGLPEHVSFDHDLFPEHYPNSGIDPKDYKEKTGLDCAKWMVEYCLDKDEGLPQWTCHSLNANGRAAINTYMRTVSSVLGIHKKNLTDPQLKLKFTDDSL